jgi:hypothetical protein
MIHSEIAIKVRWPRYSLRLQDLAPECDATVAKREHCAASSLQGWHIQTASFEKDPLLSQLQPRC